MTTTASEGETAHLSDPSPHSKRPPRLCTAINSQIVLPDRGPNGDGTEALSGDPISANHVMAILDWVVARLEDDAGWDAIWDSPGGEHPFPDQIVAAEEVWARRMDEIFLGCGYGGPDIVSGLGHREIYRRFALMREPERISPFAKKDPDAPEPFVGPPTPNTDPVVSLFVACQHLTTYGALGRGLGFDSDLSAAGVPASQLAFMLDVFKGKGHWYSPGQVSATVPSTPISSEAAHNANAAATVAGAQFGPGTIYTYNPVGFTSELQAMLPLEDVTFDQEGNPMAMPLKAIKAVLDAEKQVNANNKTAASAAALANSIVKGATGVSLPPHEPNSLLHDLVGLAETAQDIAPSNIYSVSLPLKYVQLGGSHVSMILRRYKVGTHEVVQLFDTSAHAVSGGAVAATATDIERDYTMFSALTPYRGIFAAEAYGTAPRGSAKFVGMGTLPATNDAPALDDHLRKVRPAGLARLVVVDQRQRPDDPTVDDILYISRMMPMWSPASPTRNFTISRLLYSLRNTPFRKSLKVYWIVYAARSGLASAMWQEGARALGLNKLMSPDTKTKDVTMAVAILSHDNNGEAKEIWRSRVAGGEGRPPKSIKQTFVSTGAPPLDWLLAKRDSYSKRLADNVNERSRRIGELIKQAKAAAAAGDKAGVQAAQAEILSIVNERPPILDEIADYLADPLAEQHQHPTTNARNDPFRSYVNKAAVDGTVVTPGFFVW